MKKVFAVILAVMMTCGLVGCAGSTQAAQSTSVQTENGSIYSSKYGDTLYAKNIPATVQYNDKEISLLGVNVYEDYSKSGYSVYVVATLDVSALSETEMYWLTEEDLDIWCYADSEDNRLDNERFSVLGKLQTDSSSGEPYRLQWVFTNMGSAFPFSFVSSELSVSVRVEQKEKYKNDEGKEYNKTNDIFYNYDVPAKLSGSEKIGEPLHGYIADWLENTLDFYSGLLG